MSNNITLYLNAFVLFRFIFVILAAVFHMQVLFVLFLERICVWRERRGEFCGHCIILSTESQILVNLYINILNFIWKYKLCVCVFMCMFCIYFVYCIYRTCKISAILIVLMSNDRKFLFYPIFPNSLTIDLKRKKVEIEQINGYSHSMKWFW